MGDHRRPVGLPRQGFALAGGASPDPAMWGGWLGRGSKAGTDC
jgi:hypothetical protein